MEDEDAWSVSMHRVIVRSHCIGTVGREKSSNTHTSTHTPSHPSVFCIPPPPHHPDRKRHVSTLLNVRGMMRQAERQEILNVVKDFECSAALMCRDRAIFSDIPIPSEVHCLSLGLLRLAMSVANWLSERRHGSARRQQAGGKTAATHSHEQSRQGDETHRED